MCEKIQNFAKFVCLFFLGGGVHFSEGISSTQESGRLKNKNFYELLNFSHTHILYYCVERLNLTFKKKGPFSSHVFARYLPHVSIFVLVYLLIVPDRNL